MTAATRPRRLQSGPPAPPRPGTVEVWKLSLDLPGSSLTELRELLSGDELARAARFRRRVDAERFVAARGQLRRILGACLGRCPSEIVFAYGPYGKPSVEEGRAGRTLDFNLAHSEGIALLAVTGGSSVGVDVELPRPGFGGIDIARSFFAAGEVDRLVALPAAEREAGFLRCWTRKEAYVKARGAGLQLGLGSFEVSLAGGAARLLRCAGEDELERWSLIDLSDRAQRYYAALAVEEPSPIVQERVWKDRDGGA
jgi:4'-phosphopantetheinyl transferase